MALVSSTQHQRLLLSRCSVFLLFVFKVLRLLKTLILTRPCQSVCLSVCLSLTSGSSSKVIISRLGTVTASDMKMHHVLMILTLTFIQGHTDLNHEKNNCSIISETCQAMPIKFAVRIVRLVYTNILCMLG